MGKWVCMLLGYSNNNPQFILVVNSKELLPSQVDLRYLQTNSYKMLAIITARLLSEVVNRIVDSVGQW